MDTDTFSELASILGDGRDDAGSAVEFYREPELERAAMEIMQTNAEVVKRYLLQDLKKVVENKQGSVWLLQNTPLLEKACRRIANIRKQRNMLEQQCKQMEQQGVFTENEISTTQMTGQMKLLEQEQELFDRLLTLYRERDAQIYEYSRKKLLTAQAEEDMMLNQQLLKSWILEIDQNSEKVVAHLDKQKEQTQAEELPPPPPKPKKATKPKTKKPKQA